VILSGSSTSPDVGGTVLVGVGAPLLASGVRSLVERAPEEAAWEAYSAQQRGVRPSGPTGSALSFSFAPARGGAGASLSVAF
jgi:hypothetical protein